MSSKTTKAEKNEEIIESEDQQSPQTEVSAEDVSSDELSLEKQLEESQAKVKEYWEQILRSRADMENYRKRAARDVENAHKYGLKGFIEELLPVVDSMEMGLNAATGENATLESICEGSELTMQMFVQVLEKQGLNQINPLGEKFDPEQHQAISMVDDETAESNTVVNVLQKGFSLNDRLVRPAMVMVAK